MSGELPCPKCAGAAVSEDGPASLEHYRCSRCGHVFDVRVHYIEEPRSLGITVYKALVPAGTLVEARKNRMKARKVFENRSNFYPEDIDSQMAQQQPLWNLGFYSADEVEELKEAAVRVGLEVEFVLTTS